MAVKDLMGFLEKGNRVAEFLMGKPAQQASVIGGTFGGGMDSMLSEYVRGIQNSPQMRELEIRRTEELHRYRAAEMMYGSGIRVTPSQNY